MSDTATDGILGWWRTFLIQAEYTIDLSLNLTEQVFSVFFDHTARMALLQH